MFTNKLFRMHYWFTYTIKKERLEGFYPVYLCGFEIVCQFSFENLQKLFKTKKSAVSKLLYRVAFKLSYFCQHSSTGLWSWDGKNWFKKLVNFFSLVWNVFHQTIQMFGMFEDISFNSFSQQFDYRLIKCIFLVQFCLLRIYKIYKSNSSLEITDCSGYKQWMFNT